MDRALLAPTLEVVEMINDFVLFLIPGDEKEYLSSDSSCQADADIGIDGDWGMTGNCLAIVVAIIAI
ncbi:unnamed protein product [Cuscuta campestris]|uniref:Uncharacterized protein n=1 Tax=Cuscuta campestris TaxID=132261 RepID=A0A484LP38_9ASTE|nr:unnamed protein product [Cuscuta campestris]